MKRLAALALATLLAGCGQAGTAGPSAAPATVTATPTASPSPTPSPSPSPVRSATGAITLRAPLANATVSSPVTISGDASVFEAALQWRITDTSGRVIVGGNTTASQGAPGRGDYTELVRIPVTLR
jgi:ABC-type glycerol-3-phosphate transport system substrate-binding protein